MTNIKAFVNRHAVVTYYILVFVLSWGGIFLVLGPSRLLGTNWQSGPLFLTVALAATLAPGVAGILLTGLVSGLAGYRELLSHLLRWRTALRWYAAALLIAPLLTTATLLGLSLLSPEFLPRIFTTHELVGLVLPGLAAGLMGGFFEELGWTGFAIPRLRARYGIFTTGLTVGIVWGAWHFPLFWGSDSFAAALPLALLVVRLLSWLPAYRVLMVWIYDRTGSLLVPILMHASLIASQLVLLPPAMSEAGFLTSTLVWAVALWVVVAAVVAANGGRITRQPLRVELRERQPGVKQAA